MKRVIAKGLLVMFSLSSIEAADRLALAIELHQVTSCYDNALKEGIDRTNEAVGLDDFGSEELLERSTDCIAVSTSEECGHGTPSRYVADADETVELDAFDSGDDLYRPKKVNTDSMVSTEHNYMEQSVHITMDIYNDTHYLKQGDFNGTERILFTVDSDDIIRSFVYNKNKTKLLIKTNKYVIMYDLQEEQLTIPYVIDQKDYVWSVNYLDQQERILAIKTNSSLLLLDILTQQQQVFFKKDLQEALFFACYNEKRKEFLIWTDRRVLISHISSERLYQMFVAPRGSIDKAFYDKNDNRLLIKFVSGGVVTYDIHCLDALKHLVLEQEPMFVRFSECEDYEEPVEVVEQPPLLLPEVEMDQKSVSQYFSIFLCCVGGLVALCYA